MVNEIGALVIDVEGKELTQEERELIAHPLVGGVILFARNYATREQLKHLCQTIRNASKTPLLIMVDQEGGRVQRFLHEFTRLPAMSIFGDIYTRQPEKACYLAKEVGWLMATELLSIAIDLSLAPVLDINKGKNSVIGERAFHSDLQVIMPLANAFMQGMQEAGMAATGKHFPGHGSVLLDSHVALPRDERTLNEIESDDMAIFAHLISKNIAAIMTAHIVFPQIDSLPVSFSYTWLQKILRSRLAFTGVIFSDDLNMGGANISTIYTERVTAAREAGCDFVLLCNNRQGVIQVLDDLPYASHQVNYDKWRKVQGKFSQTHLAYEKQPRWQKIHDFLIKEFQDEAINLK